MTDQDPGKPYKRPDLPHKRILSSSHLVSKKTVELNEVEYGWIVAPQSRDRRYVWRIEMNANVVWSMNMQPLAAAVVSLMRQI